MAKLKVVVLALVVFLALLATGILTGSFSIYLFPEPPPEFASGKPISVQPAVVGYGSEITFSATWRDDDHTRVIVCRDNRGLRTKQDLSKYCLGGEWCSTQFTEEPGGRAFETTHCTTTISPSETYGGVVSYHIYVCDNRSWCAGPKSGTFTIVENEAPSLRRIDSSSTLLSPGDSVRFTASWEDPNQKDRAMLTVCMVDSTDCPAQRTICSSDWALSGDLECNHTYSQDAIPGEKTYYAYVCDSAGNLCSTPRAISLIVNEAPEIISTSTEPGSVNGGETIVFSAYWSDQDSRGEEAKLWVCKGSAFDYGATRCDPNKGSWCRPVPGTAYSSNPVLECETTVSATEHPDKKNYYAFVCDDEGACSAPSFGTFIVEPSQ